MARGYHPRDSIKERLAKLTRMGSPSASVVRNGLIGHARISGSVPNVHQRMVFGLTHHYLAAVRSAEFCVSMVNAIPAGKTPGQHLSCVFPHTHVLNNHYL